MSLPAENEPMAICTDCEHSTFDCDATGCGGKYNAGFRSRAQLSDSDKLSAILENQVWLTNQVAGMMGQFENHPMFKLLRGRTK
jgi:hypothetical protein